MKQFTVCPWLNTWLRHVTASLQVHSTPMRNAPTEWENFCKHRRPRPQKIRVTLTSYSAGRHLCGPSPTTLILYPPESPPIGGLPSPRGPPVRHTTHPSASHWQVVREYACPPVREKRNNERQCTTPSSGNKYPIIRSGRRPSFPPSRRPHRPPLIILH